MEMYQLFGIKDAPMNTTSGKLLNPSKLLENILEGVTEGEELKKFCNNDR